MLWSDEDQSVKGGEGMDCFLSHSSCSFILSAQACSCSRAGRARGHHRMAPNEQRLSTRTNGHVTQTSSSLGPCPGHLQARNGEDSEEPFDLG